MSDEEYIKNISSVSTEELFDALEYYGYDSYYAVLWRATIEELKKRSENRPKGRWIRTNGTYYCSNCKHYAYESQRFNFCQDCGADMRGDKE
jgi:hypothetical protein